LSAPQRDWPRHIGDDLIPRARQIGSNARSDSSSSGIVSAARIFHARLLRSATVRSPRHRIQILDIALFGQFNRGLDAIARNPAPDLFESSHPSSSAQRRLFLVRSCATDTP